MSEKLYYYGTTFTAVGHYFFDITGGGFYRPMYMDFDLIGDSVEKLLIPTKVGYSECHIWTNKNYSFTGIFFNGSPCDKRPNCRSVFFKIGAMPEKALWDVINENTLACKIIQEII